MPVVTVSLAPLPSGRYAVTVNGGKWVAAGSVERPEDAVAWARQRCAERMAA